MWNDKETGFDLLGNEKIAETILQVIGDQHLRPLTIGVYGDWGVGKSSIITLLQQKVDEMNSIGKKTVHCIVFNGWYFQGYEDAKTSLMETVVSELVSLQPTDETIKAKGKKLFKRINWLKLAKVSANAALTLMTGLPAGSLLHKAGAAIEKGKSLIGGKEENADSSILDDPEEETVTNQIRNFRKEFGELIQSSKVEHIIVLVDDLDRCLPESVIDILEAIRLFLFVEGTTFVISADEKMIEYAVRKHFPDLPASYAEYTRKYLEKLIQVPIRIPSLNNLQTGNYIKFLLLQQHLGNDLEKLKSVYDKFESKKKFPYDNVELDINIITEALGEQSQVLKETIHIANVLGPILGKSLTGNPRNVKRFMNTLFLRQRIARIYGLDTQIKLGVLSKLMLLERFQPEQFDKVIEDVNGSASGLSKILADLEETNTSNKNSSGSKKNQSVNNDPFSVWSRLNPPLGQIDLRPYIFISKEKAIGFTTEDGLPPKLQELLSEMVTGNIMLLNAATNKLTALNIQEATIIYEELEKQCQLTDDLKTAPAPMKGILKLMEVFPALEEKVIKLLDSFPNKELGVWAASELSGVKKAIAQRKQLLSKWKDQAENNNLKAVATQQLKNT